MSCLLALVVIGLLIYAAWMVYFIPENAPEKVRLLINKIREKIKL